MMRKLFHQHYRFTEAEFKVLWEQCFFALDANVLLNLYRYSENTTEQLLSLLEGISTRIAIPYQFAREFQRNRIVVISEQIKNYLEAEKTLKEFDEKQLKPIRRHPFLSTKSMKALVAVQRELEQNRRKHEVLFSNDPYLDRITQLIGTVGDPPADLDALHTKAKQRYSILTPPGYEDLKEKGEPDAYGDCIGWFQMLELAKKLGKPAMLVTDDTKEDWWQISGGRTIGPRPELKEEFLRETGQLFHMYSSDQFMSYANTYLSQNINQDAIEEVKMVMMERLQTARTNKPVIQLATAPADEKPSDGRKPVAETSSLKPTLAEAAEISSEANLKPTS